MVNEYAFHMAHKILIVNQNSGYLTIDVANAFITEYDEVVLMYGLNRVTERTLHPKVKVQKTITYNRTSTVKRLWTWGICTLHLGFLLAWKYRGYKVLYYTNPPMSYFNALLFSNPFSVVVFDTYPDVLKLIGINESSWIYKFWKFVNIKVFGKAVQIITLSEGMKGQLLNYVNGDKIKVVSIWPASENFKPVTKNNNPFLKEHGWQDKFIVLYSGNMGIGHKLDVLVDTAEVLKDYKDILFLFIGEGAKKSLLQKIVKDKGLGNVKFLTWQSADILPYSLAAADLAVVALAPEATYASVPSKTFNYMSVGAPILGIGSEGSELEGLINSYKLGLYSKLGDIEIICNFLLSLRNENKAIHKELVGNSLSASRLYNFYLANEYVF